MASSNWKTWDELAGLTRDRQVVFWGASNWIERMLEPKVEGAFESLDTLRPTLEPIFAREVGPRFLAWDVANERANAAGEPQTELEMEGRLYYQRTFKYPALTLGILRSKLPPVGALQDLDAFLTATGCEAARSKPD